MIRVKAKNLLLYIMIAMASLCLFACKDAKIEVESIGFTEQSINLLVGEEYSPQIKILPSYATDRSYTLVSEDVTVLRVEGGTIIALKAGMGINLKVTSNENPNINDMISVNVYNEAQELNVPNNLTFDGDRFLFDAVDNASSYCLKINDQEINIGNNTEYPFENLIGKYNGELYNTILNISVKAVGDGRIYKDSLYNESAQFLRVGEINDAYITNEQLYIEGMKNISSYTIEVYSNNSLIEKDVIENSNFNNEVVTTDISRLTDSINGAEYTIKICTNTEGFNVPANVDVVGTSEFVFDYLVLGKVQNPTIKDNVLTWDFVNNADLYDVKVYNNESGLYKEYLSVNSNAVVLDFSLSGKYYFNVIAKSNKAVNVTQGKEYSNNAEFEILPSPIAYVQNNVISWNSVDNAEGYLIDIKKDGNIIISQKFVLGTSIDQEFDSGDYSINIIASGNGENIVSSAKSVDFEWTVLNSLSNLHISNEKLYWQDNDINSLNKYHLTFNVNQSENVDITLTNFDDRYSYNSDLEMYCYDLSGYDFAPNSYTITLQSVGEDNILDAELNMATFVKLANSSIISLIDKEFSILEVESAVRYEIGIYNSGDTQYSNPIMLEDVSGGKFILNTQLLGAGKYTARIYVYGNDANIFDADNDAVDTTFSFEKLSIPELELDSTGMTIKVQNVENGQVYKLYENDSSVELQDNAYSLSSLTQGDYIYSAQVLGDGLTILDSDKTSVNNSIKIKKLSTPTLVFNKDELQYTVMCEDEEYVLKYNFTLNGSEVQVDNNIADCSSLMTNSGEYIAKVTALPIESVEYDLIIQSQTYEYSVEKLNGECNVSVVNGKIIITPIEELDNEDEYSVQVRVKNGSDEYLDINDFQYLNGRFERLLYDENYNIENFENSGGVQFFNQPDIYTFYTTIINTTNQSVVSSNLIQCLNTLTTLDAVSSISRSSQNIIFNNIENATNYIACITIENNEYYIDLQNNFTLNGSMENVLVVTDLIQLFETNSVPYIEEKEYSLKLISINQDTSYIPNKNSSIYTFEFLSTPNIEVVEIDNQKYLSVNNVNNATLYNAEFIQGDINKNIWLTQTEGVTQYNLALLTEFMAGDINVIVKARCSNGNYFDSKNANINISKLASSNITISNGILTWQSVANVKQYNLYYVKNGVENKVELYDGVENFIIEDGVCSYEFALLDEGVINFYLESVSVLQLEDKYYINSNKSETLENIYKLPKLNINVVDGNIYIEIQKTDFNLINQLEVSVDGQIVDIDITTSGEGIKVQDLNTKFGITVDPTLILKYPSSTILTGENLALKLYSNDEQTLNGNQSVKQLFGLLHPSNLDITTSTTSSENSSAIQEVLEKIEWNNPISNLDYVVGYKIVIEYNGDNYEFDCSTTSFIMPKFYDTNSNNMFDDGDVKFEAGTYNIKVMAITDNDVNIVNSQYCNSISVTILSTPTDFATQSGNIVWTSDVNAEYYLIRVYLLENDSSELLISSEVNANEFDMCNLEPLPLGVYGVTIQAMHSGSKVLASEESEIFEVIRLPQAEGYFVKDGKLYIRVHQFFSSAEIYLKDPTGEQDLTFTITNSDLNSYNTFVTSMTSWSTSNIIDTYSQENYFVDVAYINGNDYTLRQALAQGYTIDIKLLGNTCEGKGAIISGYTLQGATNLNYDENSLVKLTTPIVQVSSTVRGQIELSLPNNTNYDNLQYYTNEDLYLKGVHLYEINLQADAHYSFYVAEIINQQEFESSVTLITDGADKHYLKHFTYNGICFNVIDNLTFNFATDYYYYYTAEGVYSNINLVNGGSFVMNAKFLGDDTYFLQSNTSENATIKRYSVLDMTVTDGNLKWLNQADESDNPIYIITLNSSTAEYELVLYDGNSYTESQIKNYLDPNNTLNYIYDEIVYTLQDEYIVYSGLAEVIANYTGNNLGGTFTANIMTYFTENTNNDKLLAQSTIPKTVTILPETILNVVDGTFNWNMAYVEKSGGGEYITNYQLDILNESDELLYTINLTSGDYTISNNIGKYELQASYNNDEFIITPNSNYKFRLTTLAGTSTTYINSIKNTTNVIHLLPTIQDVKMENGLLTWTNPTVNPVQIKVSYQIGDTTVIYITTTTGNTFDLPKNPVPDIYGITRTFTSEYTYNLQVRLYGDNTTLNGFYSESVTAERLDTIDSSEISTNNGMLTWANSEQQGTQYIVNYTLSDGSSGQTEALNNNSFDFEGMKEGAITASVYCINSQYFSSFNSNEVSLYKLSMPTNIVFNPGTTTISWDKAVDDHGEQVNSYKIRIKQAGQEDLEYICESNSWEIVGVNSTEFSVSVSTISTQTNSYLINSEFTEDLLMTQPNAVDENEFIFNSSKQRFEWKAIVNEQSGDSYIIGYNYYKVGESTAETYTETIIQSEIIDGEKYYYYYPSKIGTYRQIYVQVTRAGSLSSPQTYCKNFNDNSNYILNFNIFANGDGSELNPYIITTETHLRNIRFFLQANYLISANITLTSNQPLTTAGEIFKGTISSSGDYYIYNYLVKGETNYLLPDSYVGLFSVVEDAKFSNIKLSNFEIDGYVNSSVMYIGSLAGYATNSVFENITIVNTTINVTKSNSIGFISSNASIHLGGIVGYADNSEFIQCNINLDTEEDITIYAVGNTNTRIYVGGIVGTLVGGTLETNNVNYTIGYTLRANENDVPLIYIGGIIGQVYQTNPILNSNIVQYYDNSTSSTNSTEIGKYTNI